MDGVRAGNSHHQVVIQTSRQQSKYATGLLCIILEFSMCTLRAPLTSVLQTCRKESYFISACSACVMCPFLFISFNPLLATLAVCLHTASPCSLFGSTCIGSMCVTTLFVEIPDVFWMLLWKIIFGLQHQPTQIFCCFLLANINLWKLNLEEINWFWQNFLLERLKSRIKAIFISLVRLSKHRAAQ